MAFGCLFPFFSVHSIQIQVEKFRKTKINNHAALKVINKVVSGIIFDKILFAFFAYKVFFLNLFHS